MEYDNFDWKLFNYNVWPNIVSVAKVLLHVTDIHKKESEEYFEILSYMQRMSLPLRLKSHFEIFPTLFE